MLKIILGIVVGVVVAFAAVMAGELAIHALTGGTAVDMNDPAAVEVMMDATPVASKIGIVATYFIAVLLGGLAAVRVSGRAWTAWVIMAVILAATIANFAIMPHPLWMVVCSILLIATAGVLASGAFRSKRT